MEFVTNFIFSLELTTLKSPRQGRGSGIWHGLAYANKQRDEMVTQSF